MGCFLHDTVVDCLRLESGPHTLNRGPRLTSARPRFPRAPGPGPASTCRSRCNIGRHLQMKIPAFQRYRPLLIYSSAWLRVGLLFERPHFESLKAAVGLQGVALFQDSHNPSPVPTVPGPRSQGSLLWRAFQRPKGPACRRWSLRKTWSAGRHPSPPQGPAELAQPLPNQSPRPSPEEKARSGSCHPET